MFPAHIGLFVSDGGPWAFGAWDLGAGAGVREVLGWWALPVFAAAGALILWIANRGLRAVARGRLACVRDQGIRPAGA